VAALRLAVIRRGLFGGGIQISEQVASRDYVDDVVLKDVAESDAVRERIVIG
jgi:hypothetical protein